MSIPATSSPSNRTYSSPTDTGPTSKAPPLDMAQTQDLLTQLKTNTAMREDLGQLRNELGSLRYRLNNEVRLMKEQGPDMSLDEREALDKNIREGLLQAKDLEDRIVFNTPHATAARRALDAAREEAAPLMKQMDAAHLEKQRLLNDGIPNSRQTGEISSQDAAIDKLAKALEPLVANQNAALGMTPLVMARIDLAETLREIDGLRNAMFAERSGVSESTTKNIERLNAKARDLENVILAGQPQAQKELASLHDRGRRLLGDVDRLMGAVYEARIKQDPQTIAKLEKELAGVDASLHDLKLATDTLLGLAPATIAPPK